MDCSKNLRPDFEIKKRILSSALHRCGLAASVVAAFSLMLSTHAASPPPSLHLILWFDTEDYLLPADDDATKRLAEMLTSRGIRATFKLVGEKARVLERRGRRDVIEALRKHDIGYHSDYHSVHPAPAEYLAEAGLLDGIAEFVRRESRGAADVRRIMNIPTLSCYGQPGSSWAAQTIAALPQIGIAPAGVPCYVDEGTHIGLNGKPFWYANALVVYHMSSNYTRMDLHDPSALPAATRKIDEMTKRLRQEKEPRLISIFYHPCEWVHREFWDGVNFRRGANPPPEKWKAPPQRGAAETEAAFDRFGKYIDHIAATPGLRFVTASDLPLLYPDLVKKEGVSEKELQTLARRLSEEKGVERGFIVLDDRAFSLADQFEVLTAAVAPFGQGQGVSFPIRLSGLLGPDRPPAPGIEGGIYSPSAIVRATADVLDFIRVNGRVPSRVFIGSDSVSPLQFLTWLGFIYHFYTVHGQIPEEVPGTRHWELGPAKQVATDTPELFGGWVIHKEGFRAPGILEVARLQTWTLKPVVKGSEN